MGKKLLKTFTNNIGFKILAIAFAFILWLVVYNLNDPVKTKTFTTTVTVTGRDSVVDKGLWPTIKDSEKTISFSVSGKRSYLNELDDSDFYANVDLANIIVDKDDTNKASVKVDIGCTKYRHSITFNGGDHMLPLSVEKYMQKQFEVKVSLDGSLSGAKALGNKPQANPKVVKIGGPESIVSTIASANVNIKVDDNTIISDNQITDRGDLTLIDDNGDEIDISKLDVDSQYQSIAVTVDVLSTKEVPIKCTTTGSPAGGKSVLGVELSEESVMLKGNAEALNNITSIDVGPIDISGATDDISTSVDLTGYLPDGVFIVNSSKAKLSIDIKIETNATSTMTLNSSNITYDGLEDGYTLTFVTDKSSVIVSGTKSDIDTLSGTTLKGKIDVTGLGTGTHTVTVKPNLDETKYTWGEIKVQPKGKVSEIQEKQFTTLGQNITALEVDGTFDDCQALVKSAFMDKELNEHLSLTSANSINVARFLPQAFYYFYAYAQLKRAGKADNAVICVPSGNFGNITAGLFGKKMGLPVKRFIAANNRNDIFYQYLQTGKYNPRPSIATIANAMDVGDPSNFARVLDLYSGSHADISAEISGTTYTDEQIRETVKETWKEHHYLLDPHGACGYRALVEGLKEGETGVFLETAHPAKFLETVESIIGEAVEIPAKLQEFMKGEKKSLQMTKDFADFKKYLLTL